MIGITNQALWCGLMALAVQFLYLGARLHYDRGYACFGLSLALMAGALMPSAWFPAPPGASAAWSCFSQAAALVLLPALLAFLSQAGRPVPAGPFRAFAASAAAAALLQAFGPFPWFPALWTLHFAAFLPLGLRALAAWRREGLGAERRRAALVVLGLLAAGGGGLADLAAPGGAALALWGAVAFAGCGAWMLVSRVIEIERGNRAALDRLASAYEVLRENAGFKELGASAAMISHEIRNYVSALKGNAVLMGRRAPAGREGEVADLREAAEKLEVMTRDIAAFASLSGPSPDAARGLRLDVLVRESVARHFPGDAGRFHVQALPAGAEVRGDPDRLDQVFANLLRNAREAGAGSVQVRFRLWGDRLIVALEDDGEGCDPADLERIGTPFFSGRRERGGTGLGCLVAASILRAHGASLRLYSKNAAGRRGLVANAVFPLPDRAPAVPGGVVVAAEAAAVRACALAPLLNLGVKPLLLPGASLGARAGDGAPGRLLIVEAAWAGGVAPAWKGTAFAADERRLMWPAPDLAAAPPRLLSEEALAALLAPEAGP